MTLRIASLAACTALTLGLMACEPGAASSGGTEGGGGGEAASAEGAATDAAVSLEDTRLREGLWQVSSTLGGQTAYSSRMCVDAEMNALSSTMNQQAGTDCDQVVNRTPAGMTFTSTCNMGQMGGQTHTEGTLTGDLQNNYRMEATITTTGASYEQMNGTQQLVTEATYQGACPSEWRGGDIEMEVAGQRHRMNIHDTMAQAAAARGNAG